MYVVMGDKLHPDQDSLLAMHSFAHNPQIFTFTFGSFEISNVFAETCRIMIKHVKSAAF